MKVLFLGTGGSIPTIDRGAPSIVLRIEKELMFFDCGEGTQRQLAFAKLRYGRLSKVFITHLHGDHVLGLGGLLQTLSLSGRERPVHVFGPPGIRKFIDALKDALRFMPTFHLTIGEITDPTRVFENNQYTIRACRADHDNSPSFAFLFEERWRPGKFSPDVARKLGIPEGPLWKKLQFGESVKLKNGSIVDSDMVVGPKRAGRRIVYSGDTRPTKDIVSLSSDADVLIHDATYDDSLLDKAAEYGHSTASQAAEVAKEANVKLLVLTHISNRYKDDSVLLEQARRVFQNTIVAKDLTEISVPPPNVRL